MQFTVTKTTTACLLMLAGTFSVHAQTAEPKAATVPESDSLTGPTFNTPTGKPAVSAAPVAPGTYDLAGIGRRDATQETILTEPVSGVPVRFENGVFVFPTAVVGLGHNDNVIGVAAGKISSLITSIQPRVVAEVKKSGDRYTLTYNGNLTQYASSSADNLSSHEFTLAGDNYFSARSRLGWSAAYISNADPRGTTDRVQSAEPDRWHAPVLQGLYIYGAKGAQGRFEVDGSLQAKRYDNNRLFTVASDVDIQAVAGRFFWRVMPKTSAVFELRHITSDYKLATSLNDNRDTRVLVGLEWDAAAKTTGSFKIGHQSKNFDSSVMKDASAATYEGAIKWSPLTYSVVEATIGRAAADSTGVGDYTTNTSANLAWTHKWKSYLTSRVTAGTIKSDFANASRSDTQRYIGVGVFYELNRNFRAGLELANTRRSSNLSIYDFTRNTTFLSLEGTL